jgi:lipocalin-like protein
MIVMQSMNTPNPLVGAWKLVSFQFESEGSDEHFDAYDEHPEGFAIFTDTRVLFLLTAGDRLTTAPASELFDHMMAYSGRYRMQGNRVITTVDSAWHPAWVGTEQTRFFRQDGDLLSLMSDYLNFPKYPGQRVRGTVMWQREA